MLVTGFIGSGTLELARAKIGGCGKNFDMLIAKLMMRDPRIRNKEGFSRLSRLEMKFWLRSSSFGLSLRKGERSLSRGHRPRTSMLWKHVRPWS